MYASNNIFYVHAVTFHCSPDIFVRYRQPQRVHARKTVTCFKVAFLFSSQQGKFFTVVYLNLYLKPPNKIFPNRLLFWCNLYHILPCACSDFACISVVIWMPYVNFIYPNSFLSFLRSRMDFLFLCIPHNNICHLLKDY